MAAITSEESTAQAAERLGVSVERIISDPAPGHATFADAIRFAERHDGPRCEWLDGVLVEKARGQNAALIGYEIGFLMGLFVRAHRLGRMSGEQSLFLVEETRTRMPDVCFYSNARLAEVPLPPPAAFPVAPDLAVEVLSPSNSRREMEEKRRDYFTAGVRLYWELDPDSRTIAVWTDADTVTMLTERDLLTGGDVLPGFTASIADIFAAGL